MNNLYPKGTFLKKLTVDLDAEEFDQTEYYGRVKKYLLETNPMFVFLSKKKINKARELVSNYKEGRIDPETIGERELHLANRIVKSVFHPMSGKKIPLPWRMSSFLPMNIFIVLGMISARSIPQTILWQTLNQSYNVCVNFANRGTGGESKTSDIIRNYVIATSSAVGSAVGMNLWIKNTARFTPATKNVMLAVVPWLAVCFANMVNVAVTRSNEMVQGITVYDKNNNCLGTSKKAGQKAVGLTVISRLMAASMIMGVTPLTTAGFMRIPAIQRAPRTHFAVEILVSAAVIALALPFSLAVFPQQQKIKKDKLEEEFHNMDVEDDYIYFNKGL